ncbi:MAG: alpha/beta hydrolase [Sedimentisphaerales bacterium]|nr:alpha/beta hydrolase [Sedimentisphaerales bacterium]
MSILISILIAAVLIYSIFGWTMFFTQSSLLYRPLKEVLYSPSDIGLTYEKVVLTTNDGLKLAAWYTPSPHARYTILFCHGNGGNLSYYLDTINLFNEMNFNILIFDYRGYGLSQGMPTEEGTYLDARAAWEWLVQKKHIIPEHIIIHGRSLGSSIAAKLATQVNPAGLIIESAFTSYEDVAKEFYPYLPVHWFAKFKYNTLQSIREVSCPILFVHSLHDEMIPFQFALQLYDTAAAPKELLEIEGNHNDGFLFSGKLYREGLFDWISALETSSGLSQAKTCRI